MIVHTLRFGFRDETSEAQKAQVLALMRRTAALESVSFSAVGQDLGNPVEGYTHGYCVGIADLGALERYMYDPIHLAGDPDIIPHLSRLAIGPDISDDLDPDLSAKVMALNERKLAEYPAWSELMGTIPDLRFA